ncbi:hypothetical protein [uncultured Shewanella sp.]|uniref:hypothetical protein n=1 Tax=uncultured Shewanella sp. TaxID=173975 RepID=UPI00262B656E|nr:hypothetical protein [uncultured Shewanella sp.]
MKNLIKTLMLINIAIASNAAADEITQTASANFLSNAKLKAQYEAANPSAFYSTQKNDELNTLNKNELNSENTTLSLAETALTGKLMVKLQSGVNAQAFLSQFKVELEWENNRQLLLISVPLNTSLVDFFALRDEIKQQQDVIWVQVDKTGKYNTPN